MFLTLENQYDVSDNKNSANGLDTLNLDLIMVQSQVIFKYIALYIVHISKQLYSNKQENINVNIAKITNYDTISISAAR